MIFLLFTMNVYIVFFVLLFVFSFYRMGNRIYLLLFLVLSVVLGFRSKIIGIDTSTYIDYYNSISLDIFSGYMEKGWNLIAVVCKFFNFTAYGFNFVVALLTLLPYYYVALSFKNTRTTGYVCFFVYSLGFYFLMFNGMRQFLAISLLLIGYSCLVKGCVGKFIMYVILASFVHMSSLCALVLLFVLKIKMTTKRIIFALLFSFVIGIYTNEFFWRLVAGRYVSNVEDYGLRSGLLYTFTVGLLTNLFYIWLLYCKPLSLNNLWIRINLFSVFILNIMSNLVIGPRIVYIFSVTSILALSVYASQSYASKLVKPVIYLYSTLMFIRFLVPELLSVGSDGCLIPYEMNLEIFDD